MRPSRALLLGAATVAVALPSGSVVPSTDVPRDRVVPARTGVAMPEQVSFDDLPPTLSAAELATTGPTAAVPRPRRTTAATRPTGSWPAAGTSQAVLARAYRDAAAASPDPCHLDVTHLAAIGQVESGSVGGRSIGGDHRVSPSIYGPLLDGGPFAVIQDSDDGRHDGDAAFDRAMGPLQFLPGTWAWAGRDGDGDGRRDPQNVFDAALATAGYLCHGGRDLSRDADLRSAVLSYNQSDDYLASVLEWVAHFDRHGLGALDDVAFLVGSGGRASDLESPDKEVRPPAEGAPRPRTAPKPSATVRATPSGAASPRTPTSTSSTTSTSTGTRPPARPVTPPPSEAVPTVTGSTTTTPQTTTPPPTTTGPSAGQHAPG